MHVILCIDDENGMMFFGRRQSQDRALRQRIMTLTKGKTLWMNGYSAKLFLSDGYEDIRVSEDFLSQAGKDDYCYVENIDITPYASSIDTLVLYHWNRLYPSDMKLTMPLTGWTVVSEKEFVGTAHEKITEEIRRK